MAKQTVQAQAQAGVVRSIDDPLANDVCGGTAGQRVRAIITRCAARHGVTAEDITGHSRTKRFVVARWEALRLVSEAFPSFSTPRLGQIFGNRHHTSILYALGRTQSSTRSRAHRQ